MDDPAARLGRSRPPLRRGVPEDPRRRGGLGPRGNERRLVTTSAASSTYDLRPPALDDLGLVPAIREQAANHGLFGDGPPDVARRAGRNNGLVFFIEAPEHLPPLPAAVEVACYRMAQEALANVTRHARARTCRIRFSIHDTGKALEVEIVDGVGR